MARDVAAGIVPEYEDCQEALEACLDLEDVYEPPLDTGLVPDSEGTYFDHNLD